MGGTGQQPVDDSVSFFRRQSFQQVLTGFNSLKLKLLSGHNPILHPQFCGEDDLTFAGNLRFH